MEFRELGDKVQNVFSPKLCIHGIIKNSKSYQAEIVIVLYNYFRTVRGKLMYEWQRNIQRIIEEIDCCIKEKRDEQITLNLLAKKIPGQDCETICGLLDSIKGKLDDMGGSAADSGSGQIMAFINEPAGRICSWGIPPAECYGVRLPLDYDGKVPEQMILTDIPEAEYIVFEHGLFDFETENSMVEEKIEKAMKEFDYSATGYCLDTAPGRIFYFYHDCTRFWKYVRPVKKMQNDMKEFISAALPWICTGLAVAIFTAHHGKSKKPKEVQHNRLNCTAIDIIDNRDIMKLEMLDRLNCCFRGFCNPCICQKDSPNKLLSFSRCRHFAGRIVFLAIILRSDWCPCEQCESIFRFVLDANISHVGCRIETSEQICSA